MRLYGLLGHGQRVEKFSYSDYLQLREHNRSFASMVATSMPQSALCVLPGGKPEDSEVVQTRLVSGNYFPALGVKFSAGRPFDGDQPGIVLSHSFWQRRLSGDASILGKTIAIQGTFFTVLGTTAEEFAGTGLPPQAPDLWLPLSMQSRILPGADWLHDTTARPLQILAGRRPEISMQRASAELNALGATLPVVDDQRLQVLAKPATFFQADTGEFETFVAISRVLMVAVALILLIGCVNLVNLLMARSAARERELAVRMALGASRLQLIRQLSTESTILGILAEAAGFLLSAWASAWIRASLIETLRRVTGGMLAVSLDVSPPDWRIFAYTAVLSALTGVAVGLWPAVRASRTDINAALKGDGSTLGRALQNRWSRRIFLLTVQVAACLMLLAGAGLLFRGVWRSQSTDPGFEARQIFLLGVDPRAIAATPAAQTALLRRVSDRLAELPEIGSVAVADHPPFIGHGSGPFQNDRRQDVQCLFNRATDSYFETLGIPMLAGRTFTRLELETPGPGRRDQRVRGEGLLAGPGSHGPPCVPVRVDQEGVAARFLHRHRRRQNRPQHVSVEGQLPVSVLSQASSYELRPVSGADSRSAGDGFSAGRGGSVLDSSQLTVAIKHVDRRAGSCADSAPDGASASVNRVRARAAGTDPGRGGNLWDGILPGHSAHPRNRHPPRTGRAQQRRDPHGVPASSELRPLGSGPGSDWRPRSRHAPFEAAGDARRAGPHLRRRALRPRDLPRRAGGTQRDGPVGQFPPRAPRHPSRGDRRPPRGIGRGRFCVTAGELPRKRSPALGSVPVVFHRLPWMRQRPGVVVSIQSSGSAMFARGGSRRERTLDRLLRFGVQRFGIGRIRTGRFRCALPGPATGRSSPTEPAA